jgi:hypothetical protein
LHLLSFNDYVGIIAAVIVWAAVLRQIWRWRVFDRFLGVRLATKPM